MAQETFKGMARAAGRLASELEAGPVRDPHAYDTTFRRVRSLICQLDAPCADPATAADAWRTKERLLRAWHDATV